MTTDTKSLVLILDDEEMVLMAISRLLRKEPYEVTSRRTPSRPWKWWQSANPKSSSATISWLR